MPDEEPELESTATEPFEAVPEPPAPAPSAPAGEPINLNTANYEQLRSLKLSVTQTGRILAYRERSGGF